MTREGERKRWRHGIGPVLVGIACLGACTSRDGDEHVPGAARDLASTVTLRVPAPAPSAQPSYEVAIAGAQADRVHALNSCDDRQGAAHAACVRAADSAYDAARGAAERIRGSGR